MVNLDISLVIKVKFFVLVTNEIVRLLTFTWHLPYSSKILHLCMEWEMLFEQVCHKLL